MKRSLVTHLCMIVAAVVALGAQAFAADTLQTTGNAGDSALAPVIVDTAKGAVLLVSDSTSGNPASASGEPRLKLVKREYNGRQQVVLATAMMFFVIGMMTIAQQWNPK